MMAYWVSMILLVLSSNMDDFSFGLALGFKEKVNWWVAAIIGLMSGITMGAGMVLGQFANHFLNSEIEKGISGAIYLTLAICFAVEECQSDVSKEEQKSSNNWTPLSALFMGIALGVDSFFLGISAGLLNYPLWFTSMLAGISSFLLIFSGTMIAHRIATAIPNTRTGLISAGLLLILAITALI